MSFPAALFEYGGRIVSELIRFRQQISYSRPSSEAPPPILIPPTPASPVQPEAPVSSSWNPALPTYPETKATDVKTGCIPCALGHTGTCSGLLNEAVRFSKDGISQPEVIDRFNMCLDELNSMERVDLRPQMIEALPSKEKELAIKALDASRSLRHDIESIRTPEDLRKVAAATQTVRNSIGREWFNYKLEGLSPEVRDRVNAKLDEYEATQNGTNVRA